MLAALFALAVGLLTDSADCNGDSALRSVAFSVGLLALVPLGIGMVVSLVVLVVGRRDRAVAIAGVTGVGLSLAGGVLAWIGAELTFDLCISF
ncbi:MAG: hypothetical protein QOG06_302 [Gaiellaceae bacterium]|nr:hypothetical protein [Gaiellaceae bacterium]